MARQIFDAQPFSRLIGARLSVLGDAQAEIVVDMRDDRVSSTDSRMVAC
ncbi:MULTISPECIES: hotdog family protein [unclassified Xanthomonas]|nr:MULTISPECIES: hypothetical protein [unclassified Xanthomonas]MBB5944514.1 acyl-coenzyme A thioesterase PaaI-like protein [Xanthomonas sp. 3307]